jgi:hypothetical protein
MAIEEGEDVQAKGIENIFNKIIGEKVPYKYRRFLTHPTDKIRKGHF